MAEGMFLPRFQLLRFNRKLTITSNTACYTLLAWAYTSHRTQKTLLVHPVHTLLL